MNGELTLKDIADLGVGFAFKSSNFVPPQDGTRLLRGDNIAQGEIRWDRAEGWPAHSEVDPNYNLRAGDVVLAMDRPWIGAGLKYAVVRDRDVPAFLVQRVARLRAKDGTDQGYLGALIGSPEFTDYVLAVQTGTSIPHISGKQIMAFPIKRLPELAEQRAIAEVLGALDDKIAANTKLAETAMELASEIYNQGVAGFPDKPMDEVLTPILGGTPARGRNEFWGGSVPWASAKDVTGADMGVITDTEEKITEQASSSTKAKPLREGSVILTARGTVGAVARLATPAAFNQSCYGFVPGALPPALLYFGVLSAANRAKKIAHGSVFDTITMKTFAHLPLPDMPEAEIEKLESLLAPQLRVTTEAVRENRTLAATRDALLPQLMSGKLRVRDIENTVGEMV